MIGKVTFKIPSILCQVTGQFEFVDAHVVRLKPAMNSLSLPLGYNKNICFVSIPVLLPGTELQNSLEVIGMSFIIHHKPLWMIAALMLPRGLQVGPWMVSREVPAMLSITG